jgi:ABC-type sugar transport system ATPase subunit
VGCRVALNARLDDLSVAQRQLLELAKALALEPSILILDEPTAPLGADMVERVFEQVRAAAERGAAVIYISHRLPEVRQIADRVTVMRDGAVQGSAPIAQISDDEILRLIVGRSLETTFPDKHAGADKQPGGLSVKGLSNEAFSDVDLAVRPGEIVGLRSSCARWPDSSVPPGTCALPTRRSASATPSRLATPVSRISPPTATTRDS